MICIFINHQPMKSCLVLVKVWTKKQGFASLLKKISFLNFRWTSYDQTTRTRKQMSKHTPEPQNQCFHLNSSSSPTLNCKTQFDWSMLNAVISHLLRIRIIVIYIVAKVISLRQSSVSRTILREEKIYTV